MEPNHFEALYPPNTREAEISEMIKILRTGASCQVVGIPGVGKSNALRLLPYNRKVRELHLGTDEPSFHFIYMDFSEVRGRSLFEIVKFILISVSYSLGERRLTEAQNTVNEYLAEVVNFQDELILFQALKKTVDFLVKDKGYFLVFLFDRFEDYIPNVDSKFFLNLRILRNRVKYNFLAVFAVSRPIEDTLELPLYSEFYELLVGNTIFLPIKDPVGLTFRFSHLEEITGKKASEKVRNEVETLTGGHGKLAKVSYEAVLAEDRSKDLEEFLISNTQVKAALFEIWNFLTPEEQKDIRSETKNENLEKLNLTSGGKITIPLFVSFVNKRPKEVAGELKYDPEKNEIMKGQENLTEKLTPSEFRLLKFLMTNADKISEKDEIITGVWKDNQTQEGVTDQALDQIIYRLRRKIEDDPENPRFIQTVKGRGYKFSK